MAYRKENNYKPLHVQIKISAKQSKSSFQSYFSGFLYVKSDFLHPGVSIRWTQKIM